MHLTLDDFIERSKATHPNEHFDYSKAVYVNNRTPLCLIDLDLRPDGNIYGEFWQTPSNHFKGQSHPDKRKGKIAKQKLLSQEEIIEKFNKVHQGENLDYSQVVYKGMRVKVKIIDPIYGEFWQTPQVHLKGCGCKERGQSKLLEQVKCQSKEEFLEKANKIHKNNYIYDNLTSFKYKDNVEILCPIHGPFKQTIENHLQGKGCPKCGKIYSKVEDEILDYIKSYLPDINVELHNRTILEKKEIDIFFPDYKLGIEYNGLKWHTEFFAGKDRNYHINKNKICSKNGINLIQIFEDEYILNKEIVLSKIKHLLHINENREKISARKCSVKKIDKLLAKSFLNKNHIQGFASATIYYGCFFNERLVAVMSFINENNNWNLNRFASDNSIICQGIGGKIFKHFINENNPESVKSFADARWTINCEDNFYTKLGFKFITWEAPDYYYFNESISRLKRFHKFAFRKQKLSKKYGFPLTMTETDMIKKLGYDRIWNCGLFKYMWKK